MDTRYGGAILTVAVALLAVLAARAQIGVNEASAVSIDSVSVVRDAGVMVDPPPPEARSLEPYEGYGAWVDVFDFSPPYAGDAPPVTVDDLDEMASDGVKTVYLQAARLDDRTPGGLEDPWLLAEFVHAAHARDIAVVAWYLPEFDGGGADLARVALLDRFDVLGQRFDGVALDIEWTGGDIGPEERNRRLLVLAQAASATVDGPLGAIVLPPVLLDVINPDFWPDFPWRELGPSFDVWLPMSYWSFRSESSGYGDGYTYNEESTRRLRENIGDPEAVVHGIGGIGGADGSGSNPDPEEPLAELSELDGFVRSLVDTDSVGGSMYDWDTLEPGARRRLAELFASGPGARPSGG